MVSQAQFKTAVEQAGVPALQAASLVVYYNESQIEALKWALLLASDSCSLACGFQGAAGGGSR